MKAKIMFISLVLIGHTILIGTVGGQSNTPIALQDKSALSPVNKATYNSAATAYTTTRNQENRNKLIFMAISQIDLEFGYYIKEKRQRNTVFQTVLDILEVGAATAISITNGERAKSIIADALGFIQGSRSKINKNLRLLEQQVLVNKMIENRSKVLTEIYGKVNETDAQYPFERAYIDILAYYQAGTTDSALSSLAITSGTTATTAQAMLATAKSKAGIVLAPTAAQIKISRENSDFVQGFINKYKAEGLKIGLANLAIAAAVAQKAAEEAKIAPLVPDAAVIAAAEVTIAAKQAENVASAAAQKAALDTLMKIFDSIEQDIILAPLLDKLDEKFPGLGMAGRLANSRDKTGDIDDYGYTILRFFRLVTDAAPNNPIIVDRAKNIVDSVKP